VGIIIAPAPPCWLASKKFAVTAPEVPGMAFNTELTKKLTTVIRSLAFAGLPRTTVAPEVAV
jgi:hypothetical protein